MGSTLNRENFTQEASATSHAPLLHAQNRYAVVDLGGTKIASALATVNTSAPDALPDLTEIHEIPTPAQDGADAVIEAVFTAIRHALKNNNDEDGAVNAIGIASAGVVDTTAGTIISATDLIKGWTGTDVAGRVEAEFGLPVAVLNDVHAHALGESRFGAARNFDSVLAVAVGTGIGGALVLGNEIHMGAHFAAGHVGHVPHPLASGMPCSCGATGHIESVASGTGQVMLYNARRRETDPQITSGKQLTAAAQAGEELARRILIASGAALGDSIAGVANCVDPQAVVLSGSVTRSGEEWWNALKAAFTNGALPAIRKIDILEGELAGSAPLLGAAVAAHAKASNINTARTAGGSNER
ncbi:MAG: ROK family protein [Actinomycetaceae bacterium]|nr:ROK family protein [Actinomycetaceae bacterium]